MLGRKDPYLIDFRILLFPFFCTPSARMMEMCNGQMEEAGKRTRMNNPQSG